MKILFISRAYPPVVGGIEMQNYGIANALGKLTETKIIANKKGKKFLPLFLPWLTLKLLFIIPSYDAIIFGDGVLSPVGALFKLFYRKQKYFCVIHGLDITYAQKNSLMGKIYKFINIPSEKKMDKLIMVGNETINEAVKIGIPREKCVFIPNGLNADEVCENHSRAELEKLLGQNLEGKKIIFRGGRFVKHKGVDWFVRSVMPKLPENYILVAAGGVVAKKTAGDANDFENVKKTVEELNLSKRVILLANLPRSDMKILFSTCDIYISPNIKVAGSMEGFGITAIEAGACGKVVLASNIEGLKDAIIDGQNGFLVESENPEAWVIKINEVLSDSFDRKNFGEKASQFVNENYSWGKISKRYLEEINKEVSKSKIQMSNQAPNPNT
jgi:phosphatidylinositol alpha-1,6-mannosyltransferase